MKKRVVIPVVVVAILALAFVWRLAQAGKTSREMTPEIGIVEGRLKACPSAGACRSSVGEVGNPAYFPPLVRTMPGPEYLGLVVRSVEALGGVVRKREANYLHAEFKSGFWGFVDDVEVLVGFDERVDVRSASRVGKSDLGANGKRLGRLREKMGAGHP